jgi:uncharacterized protein (TIGR02145 family)
MKTKRFISVAIFIVLAFTFFACSSDDGGSDGNNCDPSATVTIGSQTWLKCNLNVMHNEGNGNSWCYEGTDYSVSDGVSSTGTLKGEEGCSKFGRLYDWAAAMNLPSSCNSNFCTDQIGEPHQGICPDGFHIPTNAEWDELYSFVDASSGESNPYGVSMVGKYLKASSGWFSKGNGTDEFRFSALPGGERINNNDRFSNAGRNGYWWSFNESDLHVGDLHLENRAYRQGMNYNTSGAGAVIEDKMNGYSVRCVQN